MSETAKQMVRVVDIPLTATAREAERLLNEACESGAYYYKMGYAGPANGLPDGVSMRVVFLRHVKSDKPESAR